MAKKKKADTTSLDDIEIPEHIKRQMELQQKEEEIIPELAGHLQPSGIGGEMVHHPLVISMNAAPGHYAFVNYLYREGKQAADKAIKEHDFVSYVLLHERPYQVGAFMEIADKIDDDKTYWELVGEVYIDSENPWRHPDEWEKLLKSGRQNRDHIMSEEERVFFDELPETLTIYRGFAFTNRVGWSWTLDREKAVWFAERFADELGGFPQVVNGTVSKQDAIAYFERREEKEILANPESVTVVAVESLRELDELDESEVKSLVERVSSNHRKWCSENKDATIGELSAYLHKALLQCQDLGDKGDPQIETYGETPEPLSSWLSGFQDHDGESFSYREEQLSEDLGDVQELLRAVGPDTKVSDKFREQN